MTSKTVLQKVSLAILFAAVLVMPVANANAEILTLPATASISEQTLLDRSVVISAFDYPEATYPLFLPLTDVIDQNQPSGPVYMAAFAQGDLAQSFKQTNANISGAGILLQASVGTTDNVTIQVWDGLPNAGGTMLAEASAMGTAGSWVDVFWTAVLITPATTYYLVFVGNTTLGIAGDTGNPYPDGQVYANPGFQSFPSFDYAFRTYYDDEVALERSTWANVKALFY